MLILTGASVELLAYRGGTRVACFGKKILLVLSLTERGIHTHVLQQTEVSLQLLVGNCDVIFVCLKAI